MIDFLAAMTTEGVATGVMGTTVLGLAALVVKRGFNLNVGKNGKSNGDGKSVSRIECSIIHTSLEKLEKERHDAVVAGLNEVKTSVGRIYDELFKKQHPS